jgi:hypothetical protein
VAWSSKGFLCSQGVLGRPSGSHKPDTGCGTPTRPLPNPIDVISDSDTADIDVRRKDPIPLPEWTWRPGGACICTLDALSTKAEGEHEEEDVAEVAAVEPDMDVECDAELIDSIVFVEGEDGRELEDSARRLLPRLLWLAPLPLRAPKKPGSGAGEEGLPTIKAALPCARLHLSAIRQAAWMARSTLTREVEETGVWERRSI